MDAAQVIADVMDEWQAGIDAHDPGRVAAAFTEDAVFQGLRPYGVGRNAVTDYYASQPTGMTVTYRALESRSAAEGVVIGYLAATFDYPDRPVVELTVSVVLTRDRGRWLVAQYHASPMPATPTRHSDVGSRGPDTGKYHAHDALRVRTGEGADATVGDEMHRAGDHFAEK